VCLADYLASADFEASALRGNYSLTLEIQPHAPPTADG
jgi:hypothetical protein